MISPECSIELSKLLHSKARMNLLTLSINNRLRGWLNMIPLNELVSLRGSMLVLRGEPRAKQTQLPYSPKESSKMMLKTNYRLPKHPC